MIGGEESVTSGGVRGLPSRIVKIVYSEASFNDAENARGGGNLIHYLYFYEPHPNDEARLLLAMRPGSKVSVYDCNHALVSEEIVPVRKVI